MSHIIITANGNEVSVPGTVGLGKYTIERWHTMPDANGRGGMLSVRGADGRKATIAAESFGTVLPMPKGDKLTVSGSVRPEHTGANGRTLARPMWQACVEYNGATFTIGSPHRVQRDAAAVARNVSESIYRVAKRHTAEDAATAVIDLNELAASLAGDRTMTVGETRTAVAWCREWASDTFEDFDASLTDAAVLRACHRHIDGGLAFVLADVRRLASEDAAEPCDCGAVRGASGAYVNHAAGMHPQCEDVTNAYRVVSMDGLWYVVSLVDGVGYCTRADAQDAARVLADHTSC